MFELLEKVGGFLNGIGVYKLHELLTGSTLQTDNNTKSLLNVFVGGTTIVVLTVVFLLRRRRF